MPTGTLNATEVADRCFMWGELGLGITKTQSYGWVIRNFLFDAIANDPYFAGWTARKTDMRPVQAAQLPFLGVYRIKEDWNPDGDANAGAPHYRHALKIGLSFVIANNDEEKADATIDAAWWHVINNVWTDQYIINFFNSYNPHTQSENPDNVTIESIERGVMTPVFGNAGKINETPVAEMRFDITVIYRSLWPALVTDTLNEIDVTTGMKPGDTPAEMDQRLQVVAKYKFTSTPTTRVVRAPPRIVQFPPRRR